jgi:hypothetical protein
LIVLTPSSYIFDCWYLISASLQLICKDTYVFRYTRDLGFFRDTGIHIKTEFA